MKKQILSLAAGAALVLAAQNGFSQVSSTTSPLAVGTLSYEAILQGGCTASVTGPGAALADLPPPYASVSGVPAGSVDVMCTAMPYKLCLDAGGNPDAAIDANRRLVGDGSGAAGAGDYLPYTLMATGGAAVVATSVGDKDCNGVGGYASAISPTADNGISDTGDGTTTITYDLTADVTIAPGDKSGKYTDVVNVVVVW